MNSKETKVTRWFYEEGPDYGPFGYVTRYPVTRTQAFWEKYDQEEKREDTKVNLYVLAGMVAFVGYILIMSLVFQLY